MVLDTVSSNSYNEIHIDQEYKEFTVREIFEALKKNGFDHLRGEWVSTNSRGKAVGACAIGQAALNLGVQASPDEDTSLGNLYDELQTLEVDPSSRWYVGDFAGGTIVHWNDLRVTDGFGNPQYTAQKHPKYVLRYWYQVVEMAREVLEPHFDKIIRLPHFEY
jgi:hypothetical protein